jgi:Holliday junction resolvasome RuvABC endonuclease subunit|tara:strand:+ start:828 stop:1346 length:519 start_codon:yes stop_codon:yes gene_type:complete
MILGLDVSTSIVGVCIYDDKKEQIVKTDYIDLRKVGGLLHKAQAVENYINQNLLQHNIDYIFIEEALMFFKRGGSTAKTMSVLQRFNGVVSWLCFKSLNIEPRYVTPISARSRCGIKVPRGKKAKDVVMEHFVQSGEFPIEYTRYGNVQKYCYDIADAVVVAKAASKIMLDT